MYYNVSKKKQMVDPDDAFNMLFQIFVVNIKISEIQVLNMYLLKIMLNVKAI